MSSAVNISNDRKLIESSSLWSPLRCLDRGKWWLGSLGWVGLAQIRIRITSNQHFLRVATTSQPSPAQRAIIGGGLRWAEAGWAGHFRYHRYQWRVWADWRQAAGLLQPAVTTEHCSCSLQDLTQLQHDGPIELETNLREV